MWNLLFHLANMASLESSEGFDHLTWIYLLKLFFFFPLNSLSSWLRALLAFSFSHLNKWMITVILDPSTFQVFYCYGVRYTKRHSLFRKKVMRNLESILKSRDVILLTKFLMFKVMVFPVVRYGCESWTIKKSEHRRIDDFELWCWRKLLRIPWTARRSKRLILMEITPEYSLEGLMFNLKLQYFDHLMQRTDSLEKILMLEKIEG